MKKSHVFLLILLLAGIVRVMALWFGKVVSYDDGVHYATLARNLATGLGYSYMGIPHLRFPPAYPGLIMLVARMGTGYLNAGILISLISGTLSTVLVFLISQKIWDTRAGFFAGLAAAVVFCLVSTSTTTNSEPLFYFLSLTGLMFAIKMCNNDRGALWTGSMALFVGILSGLSYLTRPEGLFLMLVLAVLALKAHAKGLRSPLAATLVVVGFAITASPYWLFLRSKTGRLSLGEKLAFTLHEQEIALHPEPDTLEKYYGLSQGDSLTTTQKMSFEGYGLFDYVKTKPRIYAEIVFWNLLKTGYYFLHPIFFGPGFVLFALVGWWALFRERRKWFWVFLLTQIMLVPYILVVSVMRALTPVFAIWLILAGIGFSWLWQRRRTAGMVLGFLILMTSIVLTCFRTFQNRVSIPQENQVMIQQVSDYIADSLGFKRLLVWESSNHIPIPMRFLISFRAGAEAQGIPWTRSTRALSVFARKRKVDGVLLIVDKVWTPRLKDPPVIKDMIENPHTPELNLVKQWERNGPVFMIYRFEINREP